MRNTILGICFIVVGLAFILMYVAQQSTYQRFADGHPVQATITGIYESGVVLSYTAQNGEFISGVGSEFVSDEQRATLSVGDDVAALHMRGIPSRVSLRDSLDVARPSPLLFVPAALGLLGGALTIAWPRLRPRREPGELDLIINALKRTRAVFGLLSLGLWAVAIILFGLLFLGWDTGSDLSWWGAAMLGLVLAAVVALSIYSLYRAAALLDIHDADIMRTITRRPWEIAWVYEAVAQQRSLTPLTQAQTFAPDRVFAAGAQSMLYIHFADGKAFTLWVAPENAPRLLQVLARRAPHAQIGYNPLLEKQYRENPARFKPGHQEQSNEQQRRKPTVEQ
jgi:hypothetical protein